MPLNQLGAEQIESFRNDGYIALEPIASPEEIAAARAILYPMFENKAGRDRGMYTDMVGADDEQNPPAAVPQILSPSALDRRLTQFEFRHNATQIVRQLLGPQATLDLDHAVLKPPHSPADTPWHQDDAFANPNFERDQIVVWIALQEVTVDNGCLRFIPGSHKREILTHRSPNNDPRIHGLECCGDFNPNDAVYCPLKPGAATLHTGRTLHGAGPNISDTYRFGYALIFNTPQRPYPGKREFPWINEKQTSRQARESAYQNRFGLLSRPINTITWKFNRLKKRLSSS